ncbi:bile acid:sodium symporter family protein [Mesonia sp. HuA40]|uniref:bile acid:sodium symporter family protein n=1 Tax=Mesonia sp. HuA40 TaxID=2602761 RepID=UPI0011C7B994|nr:bile acid:sodium symporter family protein [Mesonia sp. HuA40]TXK73571.1 bile acid:sodium symporter [Mesonia sp. HuA40]
MKFNWFVIALLTAMGLSFIYPDPSKSMWLEGVINYGIGFIFFFYGLKLPIEALKEGLKNTRLHLLIQSFTFLVFPLLILIFYPLLEETDFEIYWFGFFFLACLPSTVSSSVVMVSLARGNVPAAIFNASISGIIGVFVTPLWLKLFLANTAQAVSFNEVIIKLIGQILLPLCIGFLIQQSVKKKITPFIHYLPLFDKTIIALLVYQSFANSYLAGVFEKVAILELIVIILVVLLLFFIIYFSLGILGRSLNFNTKDQITARFCGSKKSLVHGSAMAKIIFSSSPFLGLWLLPLMIYHIAQLIIVAYLADKQVT